MTVERLAPGERPQLRRPRPFVWDRLIELEIHPVKIAVIETLRVIGGPLSARDLWLIGVGGGVGYQAVAYHVRALADCEITEQTHKVPARGSEEKFYVLRASADS